MKRIRASEGPSVIVDRRVSMHLMMQPDVAAKFLNDPVLTDQGVTSRMLLLCPETTMGSRFHRDPSSEALATVEKFTASIEAALARPLPIRDGTRTN